jgi:hypothetical protein
VLPGLNGVLPEAALNLVIHHLRHITAMTHILDGCLLLFISQLAMSFRVAGAAWPEWGAAVSCAQPGDPPPATCCENIQWSTGNVCSHACRCCLA